MALPLQPPVRPMLAKLTTAMPEGDGWLYEPKWDGFRCIVFRDGESIELGSRNERPLTRYFPEVMAPLQEQLPERCVVDGEIVIPSSDGRGLDFDALLQRIHPAESRVRRLAEETPAAVVLFDVLAVGDRVVTDEPLSERRGLLLSLLPHPVHPLYLTPASEDPVVAEGWFHRFEGAGLDGIVAKRLDGPYTPDKRTMVKVKHERTADCVVAGYRIHKDGAGVGSLLLGLYDEDGTLHHVGVAAGFTVKRRPELLSELEPLTEDAIDGHPWQQWAEVMRDEAGRMPGGHSRWNAGKDLSWVPIRVERVAEVTFGQLQSGRFRHGVRLVRWRPDRTPESCTYEQLDVADPVRFDELFRPA
ncbi:MAG TPA: ATP-dependent DNA ligase [Acidimicrobiales bacterium]|nr:ATP-dependent DNA ligase [Acidimicrobiales bacterium]